MSATPNIKLPVYLDYQATTPMDPRALELMLPFFTETYGNPHSRSHSFGWEAEEAVEKARAQVASLIGAVPKEIVFTSGATESNNLALKGVSRFYKDRRDEIVTVVTEHKCVLDACRHLEQEEGMKVTYLPVETNGLLDLDKLRAAVNERTAIVSVMAVNNEIGVIQPMVEIGKICRENGAFFHTDAAQAAGKIELDVNAMNIDLMSISGHKLYGPKGIGALYVRRKPRVRLQAMINGGGQERGMRSGTLSPALCVGFGAACALCEAEMGKDNEHIRRLADRLHTGLTERLDDVVLNGDQDQRFPGNLNLSFSFVEGESLMMGMRDVAVSSGSACTSASLEPSYVLRALGVEEEMAHTSIRMGIGRMTTESEIDYVIETIVEHVNKLRAMSPLWEMAQDGIDLKSVEWSEH
ncbi:MAG: IscS subfamily cysteine desulfurase [Alphaproteobacteria bacterium]|jgi:cysteine desulfurase|nr:IscS subfamily cysteine desulfurase [Alphaproteobacteria bacterium]MBT4709996.1 IscS subfamily cysteine desulfurase [Alphaproteobacteria bacterium]MBT5859745.1 IscS subfamily cysteine desulfurase [Alphaproteobacteria bacterium]